MNRLDKFWKKPMSEVKKFFLACEFKPNSKLWYVLDPVAYDITPAYTYGKLGVLSYSPASYGVLSLDTKDEPLMGYLFTMTNPDGLILLDKIKGFNGDQAFNTHKRVLAPVFTESNKSVKAWCYVVTPLILNVYQQIEQVSFGIWDENDVKLKKLLESIVGDVD